MKKILKIATRKSPLALWQANFVKQKLLENHPNLHVELVPMTTSGDKFLRDTLAKQGGKGLFTKELEHALLNNEADCAVHSMKDMPVKIADDFAIACILKRASPFDAFIANDVDTLDQLPEGSIIGTSSLRRICQLKSRYPSLVFQPLRGNVNTRLKKLDDRHFNGIILAKAGMDRLGLNARVKQVLPADICLPAVAQGTLGIEIRKNDRETQELLQVLHDPQTLNLLTAERAMNAALNGGCEVPIAGFAIYQNDKLCLRGMVGKPDGSKLIFGEYSGLPQQAVEIGKEVAEQLLQQGAAKILAMVYGSR